MPQIGANIPLSLLGAKTNVISLPACSTFIPGAPGGNNGPAGMYLLGLGPYTTLQFLDPITQVWRNIPGTAGTQKMFRFDGFNYRLANLSGGAVGAIVTTAGSGYTAAPTVTVSAGASKWISILGGANNSTATVTTAGSGYVYPPILLVDPPPAGGIQCTMTCTLSSGTINTVTVTNQGAGYTVVPKVYVINDARDTAGSGGVITAGALTGSGTVTGLLCTDPGNAVTSVPTFTFSSGSAVATMIMAFAATGITVAAGGVAYGNAQPFEVHTIGGTVAGSATLTNPMSQINLVYPVRQAVGNGTSTAGGAITATGFVFTDAGMFEAVPTGVVLPAGNSLPTTIAQATITVGGIEDDSWLMPIGGA